MYLFFLFFWPCIFFGRSIPNRDWTHAPCAGNRVLTTGPPAAAAKLLQLWPTLFDPIDGSPPGSPGPGILQARTLEWVAIAFTNAWKWKVKVKSLSPVRLVATPWTAARQAPPSMGFSRREYWGGSHWPPGESLYVPILKKGICCSLPCILATSICFFFLLQSQSGLVNRNPPTLPGQGLRGCLEQGEEGLWAPAVLRGQGQPGHRHCLLGVVAPGPGLAGPGTTKTYTGFFGFVTVKRRTALQRVEGRECQDGPLVPSSFAHPQDRDSPGRAATGRGSAAARLCALPILERPPHCPLLLPSLGGCECVEGRTEPCLRQQLWRDPKWEAAFQGSSHGGHPFPSSCPSTTAHCAPLSARGLGTHLQSSRPFHLFTQLKDTFFQEELGESSSEKCPFEC